MRHRQPHRLDVVRLAGRRDPLDRVGIAGEHGTRRSVHHPDPDVAALGARQQHQTVHQVPVLDAAQVDAEQRAPAARFDRLDRPAPAVDRRDGIVDAEHSGCRERGQLAEAVPGEDLRFDAHLPQQPEDSDARGEDGRLRDLGILKEACGVAGAGGEHPAGESVSGQLPVPRVDAGEGIVHDGVPGGEFGEHVRVLGAVAREEEDRAGPLARKAQIDALGLQCMLSRPIDQWLDARIVDGCRCHVAHLKRPYRLAARPNKSSARSMSSSSRLAVALARKRLLPFGTAGGMAAAR